MKEDSFDALGGIGRKAVDGISAGQVYLVQDQDRETARQHVLETLRKTQLLAFTGISIDIEAIIGAEEENFWVSVDQGMSANQEVAAKMVSQLAEEGVQTLEDCLKVRQGYETKVLHTLVHLLDGFPGIDSIFYNLIEDSHGLSDRLIEQIKRTPEVFWLVPVLADGLRNNLLDS